MTPNQTEAPALPESNSAENESDVADTLATSDATEVDTTDEADPSGGTDAAPSKETGKTGKSRSVSVSIGGLIVGGIGVVLVVALVVVGWLYVDARQQLSAQAAQAANDARAEKIALDYAVSAATMDFNDLQGWKVKLVAGTSPELSEKLSAAGTSMEQVLAPLQWSSSAQPLVAKVRSSTGGIYVVDSFVSVQTKTVQAPEALQSTATYSTTIDSNNNWLITDVGGIGSAMGPK